jgi:hypothetical protein
MAALQKKADAEAIRNSFRKVGTPECESASKNDPLMAKTTSKIDPPLLKNGFIDSHNPIRDGSNLNAD